MQVFYISYVSFFISYFYLGSKLINDRSLFSRYRWYEKYENKNCEESDVEKQPHFLFVGSYITYSIQIRDNDLRVNQRYQYQSKIIYLRTSVF